MGGGPVIEGSIYQKVRGEAKIFPIRADRRSVSVAVICVVSSIVSCILMRPSLDFERVEQFDEPPTKYEESSVMELNSFQDSKGSMNQLHVEAGEGQECINKNGGLQHLRTNRNTTPHWGLTALEHTHSFLKTSLDHIEKWISEIDEDANTHAGASKEKSTISNTFQLNRLQENNQQNVKSGDPKNNLATLVEETLGRCGIWWQQARIASYSFLSESVESIPSALIRKHNNTNTVSPNIGSTSNQTSLAISLAAGTLLGAAGFAVGIPYVPGMTDNAVVAAIGVVAPFIHHHIADIDRGFIKTKNWFAGLVREDLFRSGDSNSDSGSGVKYFN